jgi:hypothetical protein
MSEPLQKGILSFLQLDGTPQTLAGAARGTRAGKDAVYAADGTLALEDIGGGE